MRDVVIVAARRTAIGTFGGGLSSLSADQLGTAVIKALLEETGVAGDQINEVVLGQVLTAGCGQNPARQSAINAGIPASVPAMTINKVCGSGLKAVHMAVQAIRCGDAELMIAGGQESMSQAPHVLPNSRNGQRMGNWSMVDTMIKDGLWDAFNDYHMGITAENIVEKYGISREEQDEFAASSQQKAAAAREAGYFDGQIVPVSIPQRKGDPIVVDRDEGPRDGVTAEGLGNLRAAFKKDGTVTAANASSISDGAAALLMMRLSEAGRRGLAPLARVIGQTSHAREPSWFTTAPVQAIKALMDECGWHTPDVDLFEVNEAFAVVPMAAMEELSIPHEKINVNGGACALGHPIGASGARIIVTLLNALRHREMNRGIASLCIGGGEATAMAFELM